MDNGKFFSDAFSQNPSFQGQTNRDDFFKLAAQDFGPAGDIAGVEKEASRLRGLARDIRALKNANLI